MVDEPNWMWGKDKVELPMVVVPTVPIVGMMATVVALVAAMDVDCITVDCFVRCYYDLVLYRHHFCRDCCFCSDRIFDQNFYGVLDFWNLG